MISDMFPKYRTHIIYRSGKEISFTTITDFDQKDIPLCDRSMHYISYNSKVNIHNDIFVIKSPHSDRNGGFLISTPRNSKDSAPVQLLCLGRGIPNKQQTKKLHTWFWVTFPIACFPAL